MRSLFGRTIASLAARHLVMFAAAAASAAALSAQSLPRARDGHPDLQGTWNFSSLTPLERPAQFADKPVLTDAEAAAFERETLDRTNADRRRDTADADVAQAYNNAWYDRGTKVVGTKRSSLIVALINHVNATPRSFVQTRLSENTPSKSKTTRRIAVRSLTSRALRRAAPSPGGPRA